MYKQNKIYIIDTFSYDEHHCIFNSAMVASILLAFNSVNYYASESSFIQIKKRLDSHYDLSNLHFKNCFVKKSEKGIGLYIRYFLSTIQNIRLLLKLPNTSRCFFLSTSHLLMKVIQNISYHKNIKCFFICHGELEFLNNNVNNSKSGRILGKIIKYRFLNKNSVYKNIYYIVLGKSIKENIDNIVPNELKKQIIFIDHPYIFNKDRRYQEKKIDTIIVSTISNIDSVRGLLLLDFVKKIKVKKKIIVQIIGRILEKKIIPFFLEEGIVLTNNSGNSISREDYDEYIKKSDFILFLYPVESYKFTASGAVFDAIDNYKPIIALQNYYFKYVFDLIGKFGILAGDITEAASTLNSLMTYNFDFVVFDKLQKYFSPENISKQITERCI
jgi:hypothetical protein